MTILNYSYLPYNLSEPVRENQEETDEDLIERCKRVSFVPGPFLKF